MGVICNGPRKSGTNALRAVVRQFGFKDIPGGIIDSVFRSPRNKGVIGASRPFDEIERLLEGQHTIGSHSPGLESRHKIVTIIRNPKNVAVSRYRAHCKNIKKMPTPAIFSKWLGNEEDWTIRRSMEFRRRPGCGALVVRYEALFDATTIRAIAAHIGVSARDVSAAYGESATWTGSPSNWREWFSVADAKRFDEKWGRA